MGVLGRFPRPPKFEIDTLKIAIFESGDTFSKPSCVVSVLNFVDVVVGLSIRHIFRAFQGVFENSLGFRWLTRVNQQNLELCQGDV